MINVKTDGANKSISMGEGLLQAWRGSDSMLSGAGVVARWPCSGSAKLSAHAGAGGDLPLHRRLSAPTPLTSGWRRATRRCASRLRRLNKHHHVLQVLEWLHFTNGSSALRLGLVAKVEGVSSAESYFHTLDKNKHTSAALLSCCCQHKTVNEAVALSQMMKHEPGLPSYSLIYGNMIKLHWKLGQNRRYS